MYPKIMELFSKGNSCRPSFLSIVISSLISPLNVLSLSFWPAKCDATIADPLFCFCVLPRCPRPATPACNNISPAIIIHSLPRICSSTNTSSSHPVTTTPHLSLAARVSHNVTPVFLRNLSTPSLAPTEHRKLDVHVFPPCSTFRRPPVRLKGNLIPPPYPSSCASSAKPPEASTSCHK